ncbi:hypothetical protein BDW74DRAFT_175162 [Aspergillus multicolor]|uniref:F-box protein n=1 Tax=Aspergillus multicolor TaxID=41759 RepID=UPI003CCE3BF9
MRMASRYLHDSTKHEYLRKAYAIRETDLSFKSLEGLTLTSKKPHLAGVVKSIVITKYPQRGQTSNNFGRELIWRRRIEPGLQNYTHRWLVKDQDSITRWQQALQAQSLYLVIIAPAPVYADDKAEVSMAGWLSLTDAYMVLVRILSKLHQNILPRIEEVSIELGHDRVLDMKRINFGHLKQKDFQAAWGSLRTLTLSLEVRRVIEANYFIELLGLARKLEVLNLDFLNARTGHEHQIRIIQARLPFHLKELCLKGASLPSDAVAAFINEHRSTLCELVLTDIKIECNGIRALLDYLIDPDQGFPKLEYLRFENLTECPLQCKIQANSAVHSDTMQTPGNRFSSPRGLCNPPPELICKIASQLSLKDLKSLRLVNRYLSGASDHEFSGTVYYNQTNDLTSGSLIDINDLSKDPVHPTTSDG